jgi:hypothetical protein
MPVFRDIEPRKGGMKRNFFADTEVEVAVPQLRTSARREQGAGYSDMPPSMKSVCPVMYSEAGAAR